METTLKSTKKRLNKMSQSFDETLYSPENEKPWMNLTNKQKTKQQNKYFC